MHTNDQIRPDPDALLRAVSRQEKQHGKGRLKIFLGMAAGVGKTCAMLRAAHRLAKEKKHVVVGLVEAHGRRETLDLLSGLPVILPKEVKHHGAVLYEMDLDAILKARPELVLVDELAHTNPPEFRHSKRYQDVIELVNNGIDVYSTLNVQHLESRADLVEEMTAVPVRERVPDSIIELADEIEVIDIPPVELLSRLKEGKIYPPEQVGRALENFFKQSNLTALREMALRLTAEKVDKDLLDYVQTSQIKGSWAANDRLLVAVGSGPASEKVIRIARRMSYNLEAPWIALHVDTGKTPGDEEKKSLMRNLDLARELGAEVITVHDVSVPGAIGRMAELRNITQIIVGRPRLSGNWFQKHVWRTSNLVEQLWKILPDTEVHIVSHPDTLSIPWYRQFFQTSSTIPEYLFSLIAVIAVTVVAAFFEPVIGYHSVGFLYLLAVVLLSLWRGKGPVFFAATLSAILWNFIFIPPLYTFEIETSFDVMMVLSFFIISLITGILTSRIHHHEAVLYRQEEQTNTLYQMLSMMVNIADLIQLIHAVTARLDHIFDADTHVILFDADNPTQQQMVPPHKRALDEKEKAVVSWVVQNHRQAGWSTDTLSVSPVLCMPLVANEVFVGIFVFRPKSGKQISIDHKNFLTTVLHQLSVMVAHDMLQRKSHQIEVLEESEQIYETVLDLVSHEMRTPLTAITGSAMALMQAKVLEDPQARGTLLDNLLDATGRMNMVIENILNMNRLSAKGVRLNVDTFEISELTDACLAKLQRQLTKHKVEFSKEQENILIKADFNLMEHVLTNLILNASNYSPPGSTIEIQAFEKAKKWILRVRDHGPGIPARFRDRVFEKFFRIPGTSSGGVGLGLSIVHRIMELHGGRVQVQNHVTGGAIFEITGPSPKSADRDRVS